MLTWHKTEIGHELARTVKPPHVTDLRNHACRDNGGNAAERLQRFNHCTKRPFGQKSHDLPLDSHFSFAGLIHGIEIGLERDLLCCVLEGLISEPDAMPLFPDRADVPPAMAQ